MIRRLMAIIAVASLLLASAAVVAKPSDPPGNSGNAPGQSTDAPGNSGNAPGHTGENPGHSETGPGDSSAAPGQTGTAPGHDEAGPGNSENAPAEGEEVVVGSPEAEVDGEVDGAVNVDGPGNSGAAHACQKGGYLEMAPAESPDEPFKNTGDCVSYAAQGGELVEAEGVADSGTPEVDEDEDDAEGEVPGATPDIDDDTEATPQASPES